MHHYVINKQGTQSMNMYGYDLEDQMMQWTQTNQHQLFILISNVWIYCRMSSTLHKSHLKFYILEYLHTDTYLDIDNNIWLDEGVVSI